MSDLLAVLGVSAALIVTASLFANLLGWALFGRTDKFNWRIFLGTRAYYRWLSENADL